MPDKPRGPAREGAIISALAGSGVLAYAAAFESAFYGVAIADARQPDNPIVWVNPAFCAMTGYAAEEVVGRNGRFMQGPATDSSTVAEIRAALAEARTVRREVLNYRKDGTTYWTELTLSPLRASNGELAGYVGMQNDVSEQRAILERNATLERRFQGLANNIPGFIYQRMRTRAGNNEFLYCSPSLNRLLGLAAAPLRYEDFLRHIHPDDVKGVLAAVSQSTDTVTETNLIYRLVTVAGAEIWIRSFATPRMDEDGNLIWDGCGIDVTSERVIHSRLAYLTDHDILTGLENRPCFERSVSDEIRRLGDGGEQVAVFSVDVSEFKELRDVLGTGVADALLQAVAQRLQAFVGASGHVARLGEAEFAYVETQKALNSEDAGLRLNADLARSMTVGEHELKVQPDVGVAYYPAEEGVRSQPELAAGDLIKRSEIALWEGKHASHAAPITYSAEIAERISTRVALRQSLHRALDQRQFHLHYQPLLDLDSKKVIGAEALVRWIHPELGLQRPDLFIPLAEESGLIVPLGAWVLDQAMRQARRWDNAEFGSPRVAVNVSGVQLRQPDFAAGVKRSIEASGVDPKLIELELTEGFLIAMSTKTIDMLEDIRNLGVTLSIDDFGTGYSSFAYLKSLPVDKLKIDQSLIRPMGVAPNAEAIVRAMIEMAQSLKLTVVCEGIETERQLEFVRRYGCRIGQGYLFAKPMPVDGFEAFVRKSRSAGAATATIATKPRRARKK